MAGSISLSLSQQFDSTGAPLDGGLLYFYAAGTTTPQLAYQDSSLTIPWPNPMELDSAGRVPAFYLADGQIKIRLTSSAGVTQVSADNILVVGASSGAGTAPSVDATTIQQTGDLKFRYGTGTHTGWVRANGRTIGSASSGASERANSDTQTLYEYLWDADSDLSVSTGRGATANADWVANKTIALPDWRGKFMFGFDGMGNSAASRLTSTYLGVDGDTIGLVPTPTQTRTLVTANLPAYTPAGTIVSTNTSSVGAADGYALGYNSGGSYPIPWGYGAGSPGLTVTSTFTGTAQGGVSTPVSVIPPSLGATIYIKL